jgi:hypothetical protein
MTGIVYNCRALHFRAKPSMSGKIIGYLHSGDKLEIIGVSGVYYNVVFNGKTGWAGSKYIKASDPNPAPVKPVEYKQGDSRWAKVPYTSCGNKSQTIKSSGCGIVCAAMIVAAWRDPKATPPAMAELAVKNGYRTKASGTAWAFFPFLAKKYGLQCVQTSGKYGLPAVRAALKKGALVVCSMGPGYFTTVGHYILAWADDGKNLIVNNPGAGHLKDKGSYAIFTKECRAFFIFTR